MCVASCCADDAYEALLKEMLDTGLLVRMGIDGVYARSGIFEDILLKVDQQITELGRGLNPTTLRFPPLMSKNEYHKTDHLQLFPDLIGSLHQFTGDERKHLSLLGKRAKGLNWEEELEPGALIAVPAGCYPLYPLLTGTLKADAQLFDIQGFIYRNEPSRDPARMQMFRQREYVMVGTETNAREHRQYWLETALEFLTQLSLPVSKEVANDPFFGRAGTAMGISQKDQELKYEIVVGISSEHKKTAISSCNYHTEVFGKAFNINTPDGQAAHSSCIGFGLERITIALFKHHGFEPSLWPQNVKQRLAL